MEKLANVAELEAGMISDRTKKNARRNESPCTHQARPRFPAAEILL
jgi:hypothetical protein